ncbi:hypothetical protein Hypma_014759 [Hypsizygus marmoreus]|uniref:Uncharacterized protein n=1 Tax=Hypsizygus marmoreus TaxID=39966 RepID=A0A369JDK8_HYPMA|nr:hypothetical protein Hypma_014759 [Hypsizygus marmoreus]
MPDSQAVDGGHKGYLLLSERFEGGISGETTEMKGSRTISASVMSLAWFSAFAKTRSPSITKRNRHAFISDGVDSSSIMGALETVLTVLSPQWSSTCIGLPPSHL